MKKESKKKEKSELDARFETYLKRNGLGMSKELSGGSSGFFGNTEPTYDRRKVYSVKDLKKLSDEGFQSSENTGNWIFNMVWTTLDK